MKIIITLTPEQAEKLADILSDYQDEGPRGSGWASAELDELRGIVEEAIENKIDKRAEAALVSHSFTDDELQDMAMSCVPLVVQVRNILNSVGFRFEDDGKSPLITNYEPTPLGVMRIWRNEDNGTTYYEQEIPVD